MAFDNIDPVINDFTNFLQEFRDESDRAAVILGVARLDYFLYHILQRVFSPCTSRTDELLDGDSPLSTFSARIEVAYRMGLIDAELTRALHIIRKIRNSFAHESSGISLNSGAHRDRVRELVVGVKQYVDFDTFLTLVKKQQQDTSAEFRTVVALISLRLHGLSELVNATQPNAYTTLIPGGWKKKTDKTTESK
jgi:DNA-binding MltR family transcriptional regulator